MGKKLSECFNIIEREKGMSGRFRLASITMVTSEKAGELPDSAELLTKFKEAMGQIINDPAKVATLTQSL